MGAMKRELERIADLLLTADYDKTLVVTYEEKKKICYIHNPEKIF